ncbi:hypothetical protein H2248_004072 [Termitomyces sp. 'cryptogamus']|nr:hypothetical protein H2248_004072 [Termitomyces sp. 'cryptogamus']
MSAVYMWFMKKAIARMAEQGSRQLLYAALAGAGSEDDKFRGAYISATQISEVSDFVLESHELQDKLWAGVVDILGEVYPRIDEIVKKYLLNG